MTGTRKKTVTDRSKHVCEICGGESAPVELMTVRSFLIFTWTDRSWRHLCRKHATRESLRALGTSLLLGWWAVPWAVLVFGALAINVRSLFRYSVLSKEAVTFILALVLVLPVAGGIYFFRTTAGRTAEDIDRERETEAMKLASLAGAACENRDYEKALELAEKAIEVNPGNIDALVYAAISLKALDRWDESAERIRRAYELQPSSDLLAGLIACLMRTGKVAKGIARGEAYLDAHPGDCDVLEATAAAAKFIFDFEKAGKYYARLAELLPEKWEHLAAVKRNSGKTGEAIELYRANLPKYPVQFQAHLAYQDLMINAGLLGELREEYSPEGRFEGLSELARGLLETRLLDDPIDRATAYRNILDRSPGNPEIITRFLAIEYARLRKYDEAVNLLKDASGGPAGSFDMDIVRILFDKGDIAAAAGRIENLLASRPGNISLLKLLFFAQTAKLDFGAAEETLERIEKAYGTSLRRDTVHDLKRQLLQNRGEAGKAAEYLESIKADYVRGGPPARRFLSLQLISIAVSSGDYSKAHGLAVELTGGKSPPLHALQDRIMRDVLAYTVVGTEDELAEAVESIAEAAAEFEDRPYPKDEYYFLAALYSGGMPVEDILRKKRYWTSSLWENDFLFYAGLKALRDGDVEKAKALFRQSMEASVGYNSPYHAAKRELGKLDTE